MKSILKKKHTIIIYLSSIHRGSRVVMLKHMDFIFSANKKTLTGQFCKKSDQKESFFSVQQHYSLPYYCHLWTFVISDKISLFYNLCVDIYNIHSSSSSSLSSLLVSYSKPEMISFHFSESPLHSCHLSTSPSISHLANQQYGQTFERFSGQSRPISP